jgi:dTDP-4-amino-4,6-dideoxygalactose transaminase
MAAALPSLNATEANPGDQMPPRSTAVRPVPLAVLGGTPTFDHQLHVGRPTVGDRARFLARVAELLDRGWFTNDGPLVRDFERHVAEAAGVRHCVAMCNATVALEIAIRGLGLHGEVIVPSYTFVATAHALQWQEITPVFADIDPATHTLSPASVERLITPKTTGIIGVHLWGRPCDIDALQRIADRHRLVLLFDAAHALGCSYKGRSVGSFGSCEVFSFHATKFLNSFEGGAIVTNDDPLANKLRLMRNFGFSGYDNVVYVGTNGKMTEVCAAMGLTSLESIEELIAVNRENYYAYAEYLSDIPGVTLLAFNEAERNNYQYVVAQIEPATAGLTRDQIVDVLHAENVLARRYFWPGCHRMEPYRSLQPNAGVLLPHTESLAARVFVLPTGQQMTVDGVRNIAEIIASAVSNAPAVNEALRARVPVRQRAILNEG